MESTSAREKAFWLIRSRILNLDLKPMDVLNEKDLEAEMGMSRTPIREAIIMLSLSHLVVVRPQSRTYVSPIDLEKVRVEQFSRYVLEKEMAICACRTMREEHWRQYEETMRLYEFYENSHIDEREERMFELDNAFHRITFQINGQENCFDWMLSTFQHIERIRVLSLRMRLDEKISHEHWKIANAIRTKDPDLAGQAILEHLTEYQKHIPIMKKKYPHFFQ